MTIEAQIAQYTNFLETTSPRLPPDTIRNAFLLAILLGGGVGGGGSGTTGGATETKQDNAIAELIKILTKNEEIRVLLSSIQTSQSDRSTIVKQNEAIDKQEDIRVLIEQIKNAIAPSSNPVVPSLSRVTNTGRDSDSHNIVAGAKHVSIWVKEGTGTILGAPVDVDAGVVDFPFVERGWGNINYTVDSGSTFFVLVALDTAIN